LRHAMAWSAHHTVLFWGASAVVLGNLYIFLRREFPLLLRLASSGWCCVRDKLKGNFAARLRNTEDGAMNRLVQDEIARQYTRKMQLSMSIMRYFSSLILCGHLVRLITGNTIPFSSLGRDMVFLTNAGLVLVVSCLPNRIFTKFLDLWQSLCFLLGAVYILACPTNSKELAITASYLCVVRVLFTWPQPKASVSILWNLLYTGLWLFACIQGHGLSSFAIILEVNVLMLNIFLSVAVYADMSVGAQHVVQAKMLSGEMAAMKRLMNLACDVTVELDDGLRIAEPVPRLMAMLTLDSSRCAQGVPLQNFMPDEDDRIRFNNILRATGGLGEAKSLEPGAMHVTLRASGDALLNVEIFYVHFHTLCKSSRYFVGIREFSDELPARMPMSPLKREVNDAGFAVKDARKSKGTPAVAVDRRSESSASSGEHAATRPHHLILPGCAPTISRALDLSLLAVARTWNLVAKPVECCHFHSSMLQLRMIARRLEHWKCMPTFQCIGEAQCTKCGILRLWEDDEEEEKEEEGDDEAKEQKRQFCDLCGEFQLKQITQRHRASL